MNVTHRTSRRLPSFRAQKRFRLKLPSWIAHEDRPQGDNGLARIVPHRRAGGNFQGFLFVAVPPGSLYRAPLGLRVSKTLFELRETLAFLAGPTQGMRRAGGSRLVEGCVQAEPRHHRGLVASGRGQQVDRREAAIADDHELPARKPASKL